jgi:hypothetical protein
MTRAAAVAAASEGRAPGFTAAMAVLVAGVGMVVGAGASAGTGVARADGAAEPVTEPEWLPSGGIDSRHVSGCAAADAGAPSCSTPAAVQWCAGGIEMVRWTTPDPPRV